jgi:predicted metalloendopeptidase
MIKDLKESFSALVGVSDWLDDITKNKSLDKLNAIIENVGYPDWMLDNHELDKYYNLVNILNPKH